MKLEHFDAIVVGGGALGLGAAYHLTKRGSRVALVEREILPGTHASGRNAGMMRRLYRHPQLTEWTARSIAGWPENLRRCFQPTGSLIVGRDLPGHHNEMFEERIVRVQRNGVRAAVSAIFTKEDGLLDSPSYVNALFAACRTAGASIFLGAPANEITFDGAGGIVTTAARRLQAPVVVNAGGAWVNRLFPPEVQLDVEPFARHLFVVTGFPDGWMPEPECGFYWDELNEWYMRRWDRTSRLVSLCERLPAEPETFVARPEQHERLAETLIQALPQLASSLAVSRSWYCFRTYSEDQLPVFGFDPLVPGLFWLAAFGGFGMSTSFAAAEDAARVIGGETIPGMSDFSPGRVRRIAKEVLAASGKSR